MTTITPSTTASASGFWSYVHADDEATHGRIAQLARDIVAEYEAQTTEKIQLFLDRDDLKWGDAWRSVIDEALASVAFFIPVVTPRFFKSVECRRELKQFADRAKALGVKQLIMPILWIDVPDLHDPAKRDDVMDMVVDFQWEPLTNLRHATRDSPEYTKAVESLAARISSVNAAVDELDLAHLATAAEEVEDEAPDDMERLAEMEEAMPNWIEAMSDITEDVKAFGTVAEAGAADLNSESPQTKSFAGRLTLVRQMAQQLQVPADAAEVHGGEFATRLASVDRGVQILIARADEAAEGDTEAREGLAKFFASLKGLDREAQGAVIGVSGLLESVRPITKTSRDMKKPVQALQNGLVHVQEGVAVIHGWIEQIDRLGWDLPDPE
ncbi:TIR domain-containing protein [Curtobacterium sp. NPDC089991]|uniref:TIR domain-containing protein n=1 Tax=Curtobacterium sp. NPDC089991 TaxID=3363969 RepID=UPI0038205C2A